MTNRKKWRLSYTVLFADGKHRKVVAFYKQETAWGCIKQLKEHCHAYDFLLERIK